jgi:tryptophanyl-tRNA synthetase
VADSALKQLLNERLQAFIEPIRLRRHRLAMDRGEVIAVLRRGTSQAREKAASTVAAVKRALGFAYVA